MNAIVELDRISFTYPRQKAPLFSDISWEIEEGTWCSILGPNGVGKSTLLRLIAGLLQPTSGKVQRRFGTNEMAYIPQGPPFDQVRLSVSSVVGMCQKVTQKPSMDLDQWKSVFGISEIWNVRVNDLSVGQRQRLALGLYLLRRVNVLILDEPTSGCDISHTSAIYNLVSSIQKERKMTVIHVSHEIHQVLLFAQEVICLGHQSRWHRHVGELSHESLEALFGCELLKLVRVHKETQEGVANRGM